MVNSKFNVYMLYGSIEIERYILYYILIDKFMFKFSTIKTKIRTIVLTSY